MIYRMSARTTLILDEHCLIELKRLAAAERRTLSDLVDEVLRVGLAQHKKIRKGTRGRRCPCSRWAVPRSILRTAITLRKS